MVIETTDLKKDYGGRQIVRGLNLRVEAGECYGFLGPNGAGKSTTIAMMLGLASPTEGRVRLFGAELRPSRFDLKMRVGAVGEFTRLYADMTTLEYLRFFAELYRVRDGSRRICDLLDRLSLDPHRDKLTKDLSKGLQQKLALARSLLHDPELLVLDEPASSLDPHGIKQVRDLLLEEQHRGKTLFISSHILSEVERVCTRIGILHQGVLLAEDTVANLGRRLRDSVLVCLEVEGAPDEAARELSTLPFVRDSQVEGRVIAVRLDADRDHRGDLSRYVTARGFTVLDLHQRESSLEEAFVAITDQNVSLLAEGVGQ